MHVSYSLSLRSMLHTIITETQRAIDLDERFGAHNYHPLPVVIEKGQVYMFGILKVRSIMTFFRLTAL